ncbi:MAG: class I SAM-dependent methyltransferase [Capnocytophaga sp.]|nr:class I SAM-dependent methyltransferase [Capnocytophaga sp.]
MKPENTLNEKQGHWILAKLGKRVLRPGGRELTEILIKNLNISPSDDVVEFAPGLGLTAALTCTNKPHSYTGVDINEEATKIVRKKIHYDKAKIIIADASNTTLPDACATKVYGEAMLTMQPLEHKKAIIAEAFRILKSGGYYGIHELALKPDDVSEEIKQEIFKELSSSIRVHARPMTASEWISLLEEQGFKVKNVAHNPMLLLERKRIFQDEGIFRGLKFLINLCLHRELRVRVLKMRGVFRKYLEQLEGISIVVEKP